MGGRLRFVLLTAGKELRETVRDRRTLAVMILFPLVVYPLLALVGSQVVAQRERGQRERPSVVAVAGQGTLADEVRARLDKASAEFKRQPVGTTADVDNGRLDALATVTRSRAPGPAQRSPSTPPATRAGGPSNGWARRWRGCGRRGVPRASTCAARIWRRHHAWAATSCRRRCR